MPRRPQFHVLLSTIDRWGKHEVRGVSGSRFLALLLLWLEIVASAASPAQDAPPTASDVVCHVGGPDGARRYRQGRWGLVEVLAINRTDRVAEAESVTWFVDDPALQFSRRVVVPARAMLRTTSPLRIPELPNTAARYVDFVSQQILPAPSDRARKSPQELRMGSHPLLLDTEASAVGLIGDVELLNPTAERKPYHTVYSDWPPEPDELVYEMVVAAKCELGMSRSVSIFDAKNLPPDPAVLDVLDALVLSSDRLASDVGGVSAVRDWVLAGGRLWILLSEVQPETVVALLGDAFTTAVVDRVKLTHLRWLDAQLDPALQTPVEMELEQPAELVRVIPEGVTLMYTVNDWPAAFWQRVGAGRVYFTTLSAEAWIRPGTSPSRPPANRQAVASFHPTGPFADFAQSCFDRRFALDVDPLELQSYLSQQIGYRILSAASVSTLLGSFFVASLLAGCWLHRQGRPEHLLWVLPLFAAIMGLTLVTVAIATRKSVPPTVATVARVTFEPGVSAAHSWGLVSIYNSEASRTTMGAGRGGRFFPDMTAIRDDKRRIVWRDDGDWHWRQLELPAGVRTAPFERPVSLDAAPDCRARFGPDGLEGTLGPHPFAALGDAVLAAPHGPRMAVTIRDGAAWTARARDVLSASEYSVEAWRGGAQVRRMAVYDRMFAQPSATDQALAPVLYAWSDRGETGFEFTQPRTFYSTLLSTRVRLERSPVGTQVLIPAPFLPYRSVPDPDGRLSSAYSNTTHRWEESKYSVTSWLRFQVPPQVLPLQVQRATVTLTIRAPSRSVQVLGVDSGKSVELWRLSRPIGTYSIVVDRPDLLKLDPAGGLVIVVRVGGDESAHAADPLWEELWKMEALHLEVAGTVQKE